MGTHLNSDGQFQSDKYPTCPAGKVPLSVNDKSAQDLLWQYAQRRRAVDAEFAADLETALIAVGFQRPGEWLPLGVAGWSHNDKRIKLGAHTIETALLNKMGPSDDGCDPIIAGALEELAWRAQEIIRLRGVEAGDSAIARARAYAVHVEELGTGAGPDGFVAMAPGTVACLAADIRALCTHVEELQGRGKQVADDVALLGERCVKCRRLRPDFISDPTCSKGGYCNWQTSTPQEEKTARSATPAPIPCTRAWCHRRATHQSSIEVNGEDVIFYWCGEHSNERPNLKPLPMTKNSEEETDGHR